MKKHALVIDDSRAMRTIISRILNSVHYDVTGASNGKTGLEKLQDMDQVDLIVVDWRMPVMDGLKFIKTVREGEEYKDLPIIMVTTEIDSPLVEEAIEAGANEYVMKPFSEDVLLRKLTILGIDD